MVSCQALGALQACSPTLSHPMLVRQCAAPQRISECFLSWAESGPDWTGHRPGPPLGSQELSVVVTHPETPPESLAARGIPMLQEAPALHQTVQQQSRVSLTMRRSILVEAL